MDEHADQINTSRRSFFRRLGLVGAGVVGGAAAGAATASASAGGGMRRERLAFDVACLGNTRLELPPDRRMDDADSRVSNMVEGLIYPEGHIQGNGFVPSLEGAIGEWFCRGWGIVRTGRRHPHLITNHDYVLGMFAEDNHFPADTLSSTGLEGSPDDAQPGIRAICGGTGKYRGAGGELRQINNGANTTVLAGLDFPAPNWKFELDLSLPA